MPDLSSCKPSPARLNCPHHFSGGAHMPARLLVLGMIVLLFLMTIVAGLTRIDPLGTEGSPGARKQLIRKTRRVVEYLEAKYEGKPLSAWKPADRQRYEAMKRILVEYSRPGDD